MAGRMAAGHWRGLAAGVLGVVLMAVSPAAAQSGGAEPRTRHVVLVSVDGLRPDAIDRFGLATLQTLAAGGGHTFEASTVLPSQTLPSHTSMLTGVSPAVHGVTWNRYRPELGVVPVPTIFELARAEGHHVAAFYAKAKFRQLDRPDAYDHRLVPRWRVDSWLTTEVVQEAVQYLRHRRPNLLFVHIPEPDYAGHAAGWMGRVYRLAARRSDRAVGEIVAAARSAFGPGGFVVIVTADHGGHGRTHGGADPRSVLIPWIVFGEGVVPVALPAGIRTEDTAATILWLLGVARPASLEGRPVVEAFAVDEPGLTSEPGSP